MESIQFLNTFALESEVILQERKNTLNVILLAYKGILSPTLITPKELEDIIKFCIMEKHFQPLVEDVFMYYNLISAKVLYDKMTLVVPFNTRITNTLITVYPFPMIINKQIIIQKGTIRHFAFFTDKQFNECILLKEQEYVCNFDNLYRNTSAYPCIQETVSNQNQENHICTTNYDKPFETLTINQEIFVFTKYYCS